MILTDLRLQQYRSYEDASFELGPGVNIVVGPNAAGKTNLLEAVMMVCIGKSYRAKDELLIKDAGQWARIDAHTNDSSLRTLKIQADKTGPTRKSFEVDDKLYKKLPINLIQPVVLFEPNNLQLIEGEPTLRRSYLDDLIEQYVPQYGKYRSQFKRVLAQRNALLKQGYSTSNTQLFAWNLRLVDLGEKLVAHRLELINNINNSVAAIYNSVAGHDKQVSISYESTICIDNYSTNLLQKLESSTELDLTRGYTSHGPHRDDFMVLFDQKPALESASRGESRTLLLALKIIELQILENKRGVRPILLLDDVFSELDGARRRALTSFLKNYQTIITTTDADAVIKHFDKDSLLIPIQ